MNLVLSVWVKPFRHVFHVVARLRSTIELDEKRWDVRLVLVEVLKTNVWVVWVQATSWRRSNKKFTSKRALKIKLSSKSSIGVTMDSKLIMVISTWLSQYSRMEGSESMEIISIRRSKWILWLQPAGGGFGWRLFTVWRRSVLMQVLNPVVNLDFSMLD